MLRQLWREITPIVAAAETIEPRELRCGPGDVLERLEVSHAEVDEGAHQRRGVTTIPAPEQPQRCPLGRWTFGRRPAALAGREPGKLRVKELEPTTASR